MSEFFFSGIPITAINNICNNNCTCKPFCDINAIQCKFHLFSYICYDRFFDLQANQITLIRKCIIRYRQLLMGHVYTSVQQL